MKKGFFIIYLFFLMFFSSVFSQSIPTQLLADELDNIAVFKHISPLVVNVYRYQNITTQDIEAYRLRRTGGSGFIWNNKGYIVTNYHVVQNANQIAVTLATGQTVMATLVGKDPYQDIAVLKLVDLKPLQSLNGFKQISIANSDNLQVGQKTLAIGNPFGLSRTLTTGIVSAIDRSVIGAGGVSIRNMIQTDASINPGNSGGPLLNSQGQLIGMNTVIYTPSGTSAGVGFALPSNTIERLVSQMITYGRVIIPTIGIQPVHLYITHRLGIAGVIILKVLPNSPAEQAGLRGTSRLPDGRIQLGDIIVSIDHQRVRNNDDLYNILQEKGVGKEITVRYVRENNVYEAKMRTINLP